MILLGWLGALLMAPALAAGRDDANTLTLVFQQIHCDECKAEVETIVKKLPGFVSLAFEGATAVVALSEKTPPPAVAGLPKDMGYRGSRLSIRGTVSVSGDKVVLVAKGSGATIPLAGPKLADLKKQIGGANHFRVSGALAGKTLEVDAFQANDW